MKLMTVYLCDDIRIKVRKHVVRDVCNNSYLPARIESATSHVWELTWNRIWNPLPNTREVVGQGRESIWWRMWEYGHTIEEAYQEFLKYGVSE